MQAMLIDSFLGVPIDSSGWFAGCERMPAALRAAGLGDALAGTDLGNLQVALADPVRDPASGIIGLTSLVAATSVIRLATRELLRTGRRPLLVGGCCSLLIGGAAALADDGPSCGRAPAWRSSTGIAISTAAHQARAARRPTWNSPSSSASGPPSSPG